MKKCLLVLTAAAVAGNMLAGEWQKPEYNGGFQALTANDTVYIYNVESKMFLTEGNDWGTHASVGNTGLKFVFKQYAPEGTEWDGQTYTIEDLSVEKASIMNLFITDGGNVYVDRGKQEDYFWSFKEIGDNTYYIYGASANPVWNAEGDNKDYVLGHYTKYYNSRDGIESGTGVIYDLNNEDNGYGKDEFLTTWAFVSMDNYKVYQEKIVVYEEAMKLKKDIEEAEAIGVSGISEEKAVLANTASTIDEVSAARNSLEKKLLAYYEEVVTPNSPQTIITDECNAIDSWTNEINATTWNTQTWIDGSWSGFEGTTLNIWGASMEGAVSKELKDIPNGVYVLTMAVYSEKLDGAVFANTNQAAVKGAAAGNTYSVTTNVTSGSLKYGFTQDVAGTNWVAIDNVEIKYFGKGTEALKYWVKSLKDNAPDFKGITAQKKLVDEHNAIVASIDNAKTDEEILAIIPKYEDILNRININVALYSSLADKINNAEQLNINELVNEYYGNMLSDAVTEYSDIIDEHTLSSEDMQEKVKEFTAIYDEVQKYIWNIEKLASELEKAAAVYDEYKSTCTANAVDAYNMFVNSNHTDKSKNYKNEEVEKLIDDLYAIEFDLKTPAAPASDENPVDYTEKIFNPNFASAGEGWTNEGWTTFGSNTWTSFADGVVFDTNYLNLWNESNAKAFQIVNNIPNGAYKVQISAFADAEGLQVYANENAKDVLVGQNENGQIVSSGDRNVEGEVWYGNVYSIDVIITDNTLEIGARNVGGATVWAMIDNITLTYYGTESQIMTAISATKESANTNNAVFNIAGVKVADDISNVGKGIYIQNGRKIVKK